MRPARAIRTDLLKWANAHLGCLARGVWLLVHWVKL
jgi:hypothetical protein